MTMKNALLGAMLAIGCGVGVNASAVNTSLSSCCRTLQQECELNFPLGCAGVYDRCMASRHCILN